LHRAGLASAVTACREVVNGFLPDIEKYKESLCDDGPKSLWTDTLCMVKWKISMPEELATFREDFITRERTPFNSTLFYFSGLV
jgi:hypothetical protein